MLRMIKSAVMRWNFLLAMLASILPAAMAQNPETAQFEAAVIRENAPTGFHFGTDTGSGGPGSADPGMFRCQSCSLATLITKAFGLRSYQFAGKPPLADKTFEVMAKIPSGATQEEFLAMLRNLLRERFGLAYHYQEKKMRGYQLVIAKNGPKLTAASGAAADTHGGGAPHGAWQSGGHSHTGVITFGGTARYRGAVTSVGLARLVSDQIGAPVDDQTGLTGSYDISLTWAANRTSVDHPEGLHDGAGHEHGGSTADGDGTGPTLFEAVQSQLGLKLVQADQVAARIFAIDHVEPLRVTN